MLKINANTKLERAFKNLMMDYTTDFTKKEIMDFLEEEITEDSTLMDTLYFTTKKGIYNINPQEIEQKANNAKMVSTWTKEPVKDILEAINYAWKAQCAEWYSANEEMDA